MRDKSPETAEEDRRFLKLDGRDNVPYDHDDRRKQQSHECRRIVRKSDDHDQELPVPQLCAGKSFRRYVLLKQEDTGVEEKDREKNGEAV